MYTQQRSIIKSGWNHKFSDTPFDHEKFGLKATITYLRQKSKTKKRSSNVHCFRRFVYTTLSDKQKRRRKIVSRLMGQQGKNERNNTTECIYDVRLGEEKGEQSTLSDVKPYGRRWRGACFLDKYDNKILIGERTVYSYDFPCLFRRSAWRKDRRGCLGFLSFRA